MKNNVKKYYTFFLIVIFITMSCFTWLSPLCADDYIYSFNDCSTVRPQNFYDIYMNMLQQRECVTARVTSHFLVQLFLMLPKPIFNILNALIFTLSLILIYIYISRSGDEDTKNVGLSACSFFLIWIAMPVFGQVYLWLDGAVNYGWAVALILAFLLPYYSNFIDSNYNPNVVKKILLALVSLILGSYSENGSLSAIGIAVCLLIYSYIKNKHIPRWLIINLILSVCGYMFLLSAPILKYETTEDSNIFTYVLVFSAIIIAFGILAFTAMKMKKIFRYGPVGSLIVLVLFFAFIYEDSFKEIISSPSANLAVITCVFFALFSWGIYKEVERKTLFFSFILFLAGICSIAVFVQALYLPARSCSYYTIFLILSIVLLLQRLDIGISRVFVTSTVAAFAVCFVLGAADIISVGQQDMIRKKEIGIAYASGQEKVYLDKFDYSTKYCAQFGIEDIGEDPATCWVNRYMADYYYMKEIYAR